MKNVSVNFKSAIIAPTRMCKMRVTFDISDTTANADVSSIITTSQFNLSDRQQLINKIRESSYKLATFEKDRWLLDGSFVIPSSVQVENGEVGWWSNNLSDANGLFVNTEDITVNFNNVHSSMGLTISFDTLCNEYAVDFDIVAYDSNNNIINTTNITNNTQARFVIETQLYLYKKILIKIKKWSKSYSRAKVLEVDFGVVRVYDDDNLIKANVLEEVDMITANIPSSEVKFNVHNKNNEFNILNPSGFYRFLQERQQVICEIGTDVGNRFEYCKMGTYYLKDNWQIDEGSLTATFTARNILDMLDNYSYENLVSSSTNLKQVAINIFNIAKITDYSIDDNLSNINTTGLIKKCSCRVALQMVAVAGRCNVYVIDNKIVLKQSSIDLNNAVKVSDIDMDNAYSEPSISLEPLVKQVDVYYYTDLNGKTLKSVINSSVINGEILKLENNTLISSSIVAQNVAEWIIIMKNLRAIYKSNWRQNPALSLLDIVDIESAYETKKAIITKQEYEYQGYLSGKSTLVGGINIVS